MPFVGYDVEKVLENTLPDPMKSVRQQRVMSIFPIPLAIALPFLWPYYPTFSVVIVIGCIWSTIWTTRIIREASRDEQELVKGRLFQIRELPVHEEDRKDYEHDKKLNFKGTKETPLKGKYWFLPGVPHVKMAQKEHVIERDGTQRQRWVYRRVMITKFQPEVTVIKDYLKRECPSVYAVVVTWWELHVRDKIAKELFPGWAFDDIPASGMKLIAEKGLVEFLDGCCLALRPETWSRKYDRRPTHRHLSELRLLLQKNFVIDGEYPNRAALRSVPWIRQQKRKWIYLGDGAEWTKRDAQAYYYELYRDREQIKAKPDPKVKGDTRFFGIIWRRRKPIFLNYDKMKEHTLVMGGSGKGKTRAVEPPMIAGVINGGSGLAIDPKIDNRLVGLLNYFLCAYGREEDFQWLNLVDPDNPYNCTFNPVFGVNTPQEFGSRIGSLLPPTAGDNDFFLKEAKRVGRIALSLAFYINEYLAILNDGNNSATRPPKLLLWLAYCEKEKIRGGAGASAINEAKSAFEIMYKRMWSQGSLFMGDSATEKHLASMWHNRQYHAENWIPSYLHAKWFAVQKPHRLVSWVIRLVYFHILSDHPEWNALDWPARDDRDFVVGSKSASADGSEPPEPLIRIFESKRVHPLDAGADIANKHYIRNWKPLYEAMIPKERVADLRRVMRDLVDILDEQISSSQTDMETYKKHTGQLDAPVSLITSGANGRILAEPNPDITLERTHKEKKWVYLATGSMVDGDTSDTVCKSITKSILVYGGLLNARGGGDMDMTFLGDEMPSWLTIDWSEVIDKIRAAGLRTLNLSQSMAGLLSRVDNENLVKHMYSNFTTRIQFASQSIEDGENFTKSLEKVKFFAPKRGLSENPAWGNTGTNQTGGHMQGGENWSLDPDELNLVDPDALTRMPIGQCWVKQEDLLYLVQTPWYEVGYVSYMAQIGLDVANNVGEIIQDGSNEGKRIYCEIDGVDYNKEDPFIVDEGWGSDAKFDSHQELMRTAKISAEEINAEYVPLAENPKGFVEIAFDLPPEDPTSVPISSELSVDVTVEKRAQSASSLNSLVKQALMYADDEDSN